MAPLNCGQSGGVVVQPCPNWIYHAPSNSYPLGFLSEGAQLWRVSSDFDVDRISCLEYGMWKVCMESWVLFWGHDVVYLSWAVGVFDVESGNMTDVRPLLNGRWKSRRLDVFLENTGVN